MTREPDRYTRKREFNDHGHYFSLFEKWAWEARYNPDTKELEEGKPFAWGRTHLIITKGKMSGEIGLQIIRFASNEHGDACELQSNPYAGIYLKADEWEIVKERLGNPV